ncbi:MAG: hypothetical protein HY791_20780 [Deltaproteobacteria bacterium]|nr:hypothetical protein [Deltaproteobacteria bacterium]
MDQAEALAKIKTTVAETIRTLVEIQATKGRHPANEPEISQAVVAGVLSPDVDSEDELASLVAAIETLCEMAIVANLPDPT